MSINGETKIWKIKAAHLIVVLLTVLCTLVGWGVNKAYLVGDSFRSVRDQIANNSEVVQTVNRRLEVLEEQIDSNQEAEQGQFDDINTRLSRVEGHLDYGPNNPPPIVYFRHGTNRKRGTP